MLCLILLLLSVHVLVEEGFRPAECPASSCWRMEVSWSTLMTPARSPNCQLAKHVQKLIVLLSWSLENGPRWANLRDGEPKPSIPTKALEISAWVNELFGAVNCQGSWSFHKACTELNCASLPATRLIRAPLLGSVSVTEGQAVMTCTLSTRRGTDSRNQIFALFCNTSSSFPI